MASIYETAIRHRVSPEFIESRNCVPMAFTHGDRGIFFPCSADHEQDWQPYPVDPYSAICDDHAYIHTYCLESASTGSVNVMVIPNECCLGRSTWTNEYAPLFPTPTIGTKWAC